MEGDKETRGEGPDASPAKKGRVEEQALTLSMLRSGLAEERERDREHSGVNGDVTVMQEKVQTVEQIVAQQVQDTVKVLDRVSKSYEVQARSLDEVKEAHRNLEHRMATLEQKPPSSVAAGSTADTEGGRKPALIIGGWHPDTAAEDTLGAAKEVLRSLDVPLNGDDLFVPGPRRGYAILPIVPKPFEDEDARRLLRMSNAAAMIRRWLRELAVVLRERAPGDNIFLLLEEAMQAVRRNEDTEPADNGTVGGMGPRKKAAHPEYAVHFQNAPLRRGFR